MRIMKTYEVAADQSSTFHVTTYSAERAVDIFLGKEKTPEETIEKAATETVNHRVYLDGRPVFTTECDHDDGEEMLIEDEDGNEIPEEET